VAGPHRRLAEEVQIGRSKRAVVIGSPQQQQRLPPRMTVKRGTRRHDPIVGCTRLRFHHHGW
jgi:hypothetical protein